MKKPPATVRSRIVEQVLRQPGLGASLKARRRLLESLTGRQPELELYYELGDGHSHLCAQLIPRLQSAIGTELRVILVPPPPATLFPEEEDQRSYALLDARRIAPAWGLTPPPFEDYPSSEALLLGNQILTGALRRGLDAFLRLEPEVCGLLAGEQISELQHLLDTEASPSVRATQEALDEAAMLRRRMGHYLPAMWQFGGQWFWALDRFDELGRILADNRMLTGQDLGLERDDSLAALPPMQQPPPPLEFFFSFRSPYSYIALESLKRAARDMPVELQIRPVLPMVMRGLPVPRVKRMYIARDARRVARRLRIPFGRIADPVGAGAERCLAIFPLAGNTGEQLDLLSSTARGIWSEGIDVASDQGLRYVVERAGLNWSRALPLLERYDLRYAEENRQALRDAGLWGVPSYRLGSFATWGQDRLWMVEELLRRSA